jgi:hypothetical protein
LGYALGICLLLKLVIRASQPGAWPEPPPRRSGFETALALLTVAVLFYVLLSAVNARMSLSPGTYTLRYHDSLAGLPRSYDRPATWQAFALYVGLAAFFWSVRDWILHPPPGRRRISPAEDYPLPPRRMRLLLWVLCVNGALVAVQGIVQRLMGSTDLLWLVTPAVNKAPVSFFGPFAYRANAAQYFNLIWPVALGLWWTTFRAARQHRPHHRPSSEAQHVATPVRGRRHHGHLLLSCVLLMAVCPIVSTSRGGAIIMAGLVLLALAILGSALWSSNWTSKLALLSLLGGMVSLGVLLGWEELGPRMEMLEQGYDQREAMFNTGRRMAADAPLYGTGAGTFTYLFQFYRRSTGEYWPGQMHNDWLETRITFGWVGLGLLLAALAVAVGRWFGRGGWPGEKHFVLLIWCALGGCLLHARFDFPFQIPSLLTLFLFLCALLSCLSRPRRGELE